MFDAIETQDELDRLLMAAEESGVSLHQIGAVPIWEFLPSSLHQGVLMDLRDSVRRGGAGGGDGECHTLVDTYIRFPDGSVRRPDLAVFRTRPPRQREAIRLVPDAVVEVLSPRGELKDLQLGPPNYLANGVKDVIVFEPESGVATHFRRDGATPRRSGDRVLFECGCEVTL